MEKRPAYERHFHAAGRHSLLVGVGDGRVYFVPESAQPAVTFPTSLVAAMGGTVTRQCHLTPPDTARGGGKDPRDADALFEQWFAFFKTQTASWGDGTAETHDAAGGCDCGARYTSYPGAHMRFCRLSPDRPLE